jgi:capsule polysaccharide export protein KpsE/RkpR
MTNLQDQLIAIETRLDDLFAADPRDIPLISEFQARAARLGAMILAESQKGVLKFKCA